MTAMSGRTTVGRRGLTAVVAGIVASLPPSRVRAPSGAWHWAFMKLRDKHAYELPELSELEFSERPGVWPVSERLDQILQVIDMAGTGSTLNPALMIRQFDKAQKRRLKRGLADRLGSDQQLIDRLARELEQLLKNAASSQST